LTGIVVELGVENDGVLTHFMRVTVFSMCNR